MEQAAGGRPALLNTVDRAGLDTPSAGYRALQESKRARGQQRSAGRCPFGGQ